MLNSALNEVVEIFFSYAHEDEELRDQLAKHLKLMERQGLIESWYDREITGGQEWQGQIDQHLESADVILLLISSDFIASDYCSDIEMKRAMERHAEGKARVIPVILRDADWKEAPFGKLQAYPKNAQPITSWDNRDEAFAHVARGIRGIVSEINSKKHKLSGISDFNTKQRGVESKSSKAPTLDNFKSRKFSSQEVLENHKKNIVLKYSDLNSFSPIKNISFTKLEDLLENGHFREADIETYWLFLRSANRGESKWLRAKDINNISTDFLFSIDRLWSKNSNEKFGLFSQQEIWNSINEEGRFNIFLFGSIVGWRQNDHWLKYSDFTFHRNAIKGHLPSLGFGIMKLNYWKNNFYDLFCKIQNSLTELRK